MTHSDIAGLLSTWNEPVAPALLAVELEDDSLRDGLQGAFVRRPSLAEKIELLTLASQIGVHGAMLGFPASSENELADCVALVEAIAERGLGVTPRFLARTRISDLEAILEVGRRSRRPIGADFFIGTSTLRRRVEGWDFEALLDGLAEAAEFMRSRGSPFSVTIEDATRTPPDDLRRVVERIIDAGSTCVAIADTVGDATPDGARRIVRFVRGIIDRRKPGVGLLWHGHNDRGLALANALAAGAAGATRLHGCAAGIGERVGNTACDQLLVNLKLMGHPVYGPRDMSALVRFVRLAAEATGHQLPVNYPVTGADAFRTATGVHAAAIIKAQRKGDRWLADRIYSGVPAGDFGKQQEIEIGPMSGLSNVKHWLARHEIPADEPLAKAVLARAKASNRTLTESEVAQIVREVRS